MFIVHVVRQFHPAIGGIENVVHELAAAQVAAGHKVRIVTLNRLFRTKRDGVLPAREMVDGTEVIRVPFVGSPRYPLAPSVIKFIRDADIVHVHAIDFFFDFLAWTKPLHGRKLIVSTHGGYFHTRYANRFKQLYFNAITRLSLTWYDAVVAVSVADYEMFGRLRRRGVVCIENGVNVAKYANAAASNPTKSIVCIGRFSANKRLDLVIKFAAALHRYNREWTLKIIGRPWDADAAELTAFAEKEGISPAVRVISSPSEAELRELISDCSVLVSASDFEGFGIAAVEGVSAGLFPVLSDIPPFCHLVERTDVGMIVDFSQADIAAQQFLTRWREVSANYRSLRAALVAAAALFDWRHASGAYMGVYEAVLGSRRRRILDVSVTVSTRSEVVEELDRRFEGNKHTRVAFANANCLNIARRDPRFRAALGETLVLNDGIGVDLASRLLFGAQFPDNLNGTDLTPYYLQHSRHRLRIYLLGGKPGVAKRAAKLIAEIYPRHEVVGCHDGYFPHTDDALVAHEIKMTGANVVLVALGNPDQELWLRTNFDATGCCLGFAVGALFDYIAGEMQRAPVWVRTARLEWVYRLAQEPQRLWRRYVLGNPIFMLRILGQWWTGATWHM
jgi:alpha-1,3-mannosyltransferase